MPELDLGSRNNLVVTGVIGTEGPQSLPLEGEEAHLLIDELAQKFGMTYDEALKELDDTGPISL
jgi:hypothetical protein